MLIPTSKNVRTITDMRENALELLNLVDKQGLTYIFHHSKPKAVMLPIADFARLQELLEDHQDEAEAKKLAQEPKQKGKSLATLLKEYA